MKSYYGIRKKDVEKVAKDEYMRNFEEQAHDIAVQAVANILYAFWLKGYREKRLRKLIADIKNVESLMNARIFGKQFDAVDLADFFLKEYGINLSEELKIDVEVQKK